MTWIRDERSARAGWQHGGAAVYTRVDTGDYALDGMWKVDAHDGDPRSLRVDASYGGDVDANVWHFSFTNDGPGRAPSLGSRRRRRRSMNRSSVAAREPFTRT